jgi:hypothetical protein
VVLEFVICQALLLLQPDLHHLKGRHDQQGFSDASCKASCQPPTVTQLAVTVTQQTLQQQDSSQQKRGTGTSQKCLQAETNTRSSEPPTVMEPTIKVTRHTLQQWKYMKTARHISISG